MSQDTNIRQSIRTLAANELKLIDNIGNAEMQADIQTKVMKMANDNQMYWQCKWVWSLLSLMTTFNHASIK